MVIGISWHTKSNLLTEQNRTIPLAQIASALHAPNVRLVSLQYGPVDQDIDRLQRDFGIEIIRVTEIDNKNDIDGLAVLVVACDKVIIS